MDKYYNFNLINGTFTSSEAAQVLFDLIRSKIHFHTMDNFSHQERFGKDAPQAHRRILELKKVQEELKYIFDLAQKNNMQLKVEGSVKITLVE